MKRLLFVGMGRAGKDTACEYLSEITLLRNAGTTSKYLCKYVADKLGLSEEEAYARRHKSNEMRTVWYNLGNELRANDPAVLLKEALKHGEITGGVRDHAEIVAARKEGLVDLIIWVANNRVPKDPTVKFGPEDCDIIIENHWGLEDFHARLLRFARFAGLALRASTPQRRLVPMFLTPELVADASVSLASAPPPRFETEYQAVFVEPTNDPRYPITPSRPSVSG